MAGKRRFKSLWRKDVNQQDDETADDSRSDGVPSGVQPVSPSIAPVEHAFAGDGSLYSAANTSTNATQSEGAYQETLQTTTQTTHSHDSLQGPLQSESSTNENDTPPPSPQAKQASPVQESGQRVVAIQLRGLHWPKMLRITRYELCAICALVIIWGPALLLLKTLPPVFKSSWTILIPGTTIGSSFNIDSLGEANTSIGSSYGSHAVDPKVNFKAIALSSAVLDKAAEMSDQDVTLYGKPNIRLVDQTAIMEVTSEADSAELAHRKSQNMYDAFMNELDALREDERLTNQRGNQQQLEEYRREVEQAQKTLSTFRNDSDIVSSDQYKNLLSNVSMVRDQKLAADIKLASLDARYRTLQSSLDVDPAHAGELMKLRQDLMVQSLIQEYTQSHAEMVELRSVLGSENPKYVHANLKAGNALSALKSRASAVLGRDSAEVLQRVMPNAQGTDTVLYTELIRLQSEKFGLESEILLLQDTLPALQDQVLEYSEQASMLEELERNFQIANTILVSASTKLDLGKSDIYASYPMTQILVAPTYPESPGKLQKLFIVAGAIVGSLMVVLALIVLWHRKRWLRLIQKKK